MPARRVTFQEHEQALATSARIKAKHPDILERLPDGLYRYLVAGPNERQALFDCLACDRVAAAWAAKRGPGARIWIGCKERSRETDTAGSAATLS